MLRFANIEILWFLTVIPVLVAGYVLYTYHKRRQLKAFGDEELTAQLMPNKSRIRPTVKFTVLMVVMALLIIAAARPQSQSTGKQEKAEMNGIEAVIAVDISNSMLAEDVHPTRIDRAKQMISTLIDNMLNDKIGLVVFAGDAYVQMPLTGDAASAKMFLSTISPNMITLQGTAIGAAIDRSITTFGDPDEQVGRALIIITDGENHEDDAVIAAERAKEAGIKVIVIGIGSTQGAFIPQQGTGNYIEDKDGTPVVSRLNEEMCKEIAQAGEGIYIHCDNTNTAQKAVQKELENLKTQKIDTTLSQDYDEQFHSFVLIAVVLLIIEFFIFNRKNKAISRLDIFGELKN